MKAAIAVLILVSTLKAQDAPVHFSSHYSENLAAIVGIADTAAISDFRVHGDCNRAPARWQRMQGTFVLDNGRVVHEFWVKIDPCLPQGSADLFCPQIATAAKPNDVLKQELDPQLSTRVDMAANGIMPKCGSIPRVHPTLYEF
jgi:hypothetical protein